MGWGLWVTMGAHMCVVCGLGMRDICFVLLVYALFFVKVNVIPVAPWNE